MAANTFALTRTESRQRDEVVKKIRETLDALNTAFQEYNAKAESVHAKLQDAVDTYNNEVQELRDQLQPTIDAYNEALTEAKTFAEDFASRIDDEFEGRSDRWKDGDRAASVREFIDSWQALEFEELELEDFENADTPGADTLDEIEGETIALAELPEAPEG